MSAGLPRDVRILALGDSYTIGEGVAAHERWPVQLATRLREHGLHVSDPEVIARTGWTTSELVAGIDAAHPAGPFDLVTLLVGVNDQYRGGAIEAFRVELRRLLARAITFAGERSERVLMLSIPDWSITPFARGRDRDAIRHELDAFNAIGREEAAAVRVGYADITPASRLAKETPDLLAEDGLHPSAAMYAGWVALVLPPVLARLRGRPAA